MSKSFYEKNQSQEVEIRGCWTNFYYEKNKVHDGKLCWLRVEFPWSEYLKHYSSEPDFMSGAWNPKAKDSFRLTRMRVYFCSCAVHEIFFLGVVQKLVHNYFIKYLYSRWQMELLLSLLNRLCSWVNTRILTALLRQECRCVAFYDNTVTMFHDISCLQFSCCTKHFMRSKGYSCLIALCNNLIVNGVQPCS